MKQCMAQIDNKKTALTESYFRMKKIAFKIKQWEEKGDEYSLILAEEGKVGLIDGQEAIEHAMREIKMYQQAYDDIAESYGIDETWDEADFEKLEEENHIRMAFRNGVRNVMTNGTLGNGTLEYLEQFGIHPMTAHQLIHQYVNDTQKIIEEGKAPTVEHLYEFLDNCGEMFKDAHKSVMKRIGIEELIKDEYLYQELRDTA